jgi:pyruvate dehydrogenase E2 component (dihydrolipoamide acetyltransferase)
VPIEIKFPAVAAGMTEGTLARWLKAEGDAVRQGEVIAEIETDKAIVELESPGTGTLGRILVKDGSNNVPVDATLGVILAAGEKPGDLASAGAPPANLPAAAVPVAAGKAGAAHAVAAPANISAGAGKAGAAHTAAPIVAAPPTASGPARIFASPLARRLASQHGLDLAQISGSGPHGRIIKRDIEAASLAAPRGAAAVVAAGGYEDIPHANIRRIIARRLTEAKQTIPHFYLTIDCRLDRLLALRAELNAVAEGAKLSVNDFVIRAAALALRKVPAANASWMEDAVRLYRDADIAVAVATPKGLVTPVVRQADSKSLSQISAEITALAARGREGRLKPEEYQGGGFTVSNLGRYGIREFAAIINPPQACILAVGAAEKRPVVQDNALAIATVMTCTLSVDHRAVDGALGAEFLAAFRQMIEEPHRMVL